MSKYKVNTITQQLGWNLGNRALSYENVVEIGDFNGGKLYAYIPSDLQIDSKTHEQFGLALTKGLAGAKFGRNGVKFLEGKLLELKIHGNDRLYSTEIYKNTNGDSLVIFCKNTDHDGISRIIKSTKALSVVECSSVIEQSLDDKRGVIYSAKEKTVKTKSLAYILKVEAMLEIEELKEYTSGDALDPSYEGYHHNPSVDFADATLSIVGQSLVHSPELWRIKDIHLKCSFLD